MEIEGLKDSCCAAIWYFDNPNSNEAVSILKWADEEKILGNEKIICGISSFIRNYCRRSHQVFHAAL